MIVQETYIKETGLLYEFTSPDGKHFVLENSDNGAHSIRGVGIIITGNSNVTLNPAWERIQAIPAKTSDNIKYYKYITIAHRH